MKLIEASVKGIKNTEDITIKINNSKRLIFLDASDYMHDNYMKLAKLMHSIVGVIKGDILAPCEGSEIELNGDFSFSVDIRNHIFKYTCSMSELGNILMETSCLDGKLCLYTDKINKFFEYNSDLVKSLEDLTRTKINIKQLKLYTSYLNEASLGSILYHSDFFSKIINKFVTIDSIEGTRSIHSSTKFSGKTRKLYERIMTQLDLGIDSIRNGRYICNGLPMDILQMGSGVRVLSTTLPHIIEMILKDNICLFYTDGSNCLHPVLITFLLNNLLRFTRGQLIMPWFHDEEEFNGLVKDYYYKLHSNSPESLIVE